MTEVNGLPPLREVIAAHGLSARKGLGQNFLLDLNLTDRIARAAGDLSEGTTIEIGPGPGGLTRALLSNGAVRLVAVERDPRCVEALASLVASAGGRMKLMEADALEVEPDSLGPAPRRIVANLPFNVATPLLIGWLRRLPALDRLVLMFQKEVADRIAAPVGTEAYGRLSVLSQWLCQVRRVMVVQARAFVPPPKVDAAVVEFLPRRDAFDPALFGLVERVTAAAFGQRRKMLRSSLSGLAGGPAGAEALCARAGLAATERAEQIPVEGFLALAKVLASGDS